MKSGNCMFRPPPAARGATARPSGDTFKGNFKDLCSHQMPPAARSPSGGTFSRFFRYLVDPSTIPSFRRHALWAAAPSLAVKILITTGGAHECLL